MASHVQQGREKNREPTLSAMSRPSSAAARAPVGSPAKEPVVARCQRPQVGGEALGFDDRCGQLRLGLDGTNKQHRCRVNAGAGTEGHAYSGGGEYACAGKQDCLN